ncbi:MAG: flagellar motor switch protein FliM [Porticoccaceae bacterium]|jgi:flagellar motor switch protein FliM|nr:flagellar motor switch protein FliM [Porticoccaceae bacterium]
MAETSNLLSQEELDALAAGIEDGSIESDTGVNMGARAVKHDLTNEDSSLGVNVGAVDMINERFVRQFRLGLLEVLRTTPKVNMANVEIMKFGDYLKDLSPPLAVNTIRLNPLRGYSMVVIEPSVIFASLDNFFGGFGRGIDSLPPGRLFTPTESSIIKIMMDVFFGSLQEAWAPILPLQCEHVGSEINPQFAQIADENDLVVVSRFSSDLGDQASGNIDLVYPYSSLKPIRDLLRSRVQTGDGNDASDKAWSTELQSAALDAELELKVTLADIETTLKQFEELREDDIIYLNKADYARIHINDVPVFDADIGSNGSNMAAKIVKSLAPIK